MGDQADRRHVIGRPVERAAYSALPSLGGGSAQQRPRFGALLCRSKFCTRTPSSYTTFVAVCHSAMCALIFNVPLSGSMRTRLVCARLAKSLKDCPTTQAVLLSMTIRRSCSDRAGASRTSRGRFWFHCVTHRTAAGFRLGFAYSSSDITKTGKLSGASGTKSEISVCDPPGEGVRACGPTTSSPAAARAAW